MTEIKKLLHGETASIDDRRFLLKKKKKCNYLITNYAV